MTRFEQWLETLAANRRMATSPREWVSAGAVVVIVLALTSYVTPISDWFHLQFWPALFCFLPTLAFGIVAGHFEHKGQVSLRWYGILILIGNACLQSFFAALIPLSHAPGSFALASLLVLTLAFHGYVMRASAKFPYALFSALLAMGVAIAVNPSHEVLTVFAFVGPTGVMVMLLTGGAGLREHEGRTERDNLRQAIYYQALSERAEAHRRSYNQVVNLLGYNHDAGNALSSVFLNAQLLEENVKGLPPAQATELTGSLSRLLEQLTRLKALIANAHHVADELPVAGTAILGPAVSGAVEACQPLFPSSKITVTGLDAFGDVSVNVHEGKVGLRRIVDNLLQNACEGNGVDVPTRIWVDLAIRDERVVLVVRDNGPGFKVEQLEGVLQPFQTTKQSGHGLGLFNVHNLVEASGGLLRRNNGTHGGAVVEVSLQRNEEDLLSPLPGSPDSDSAELASPESLTTSAAV